MKPKRREKGLVITQVNHTIPKSLHHGVIAPRGIMPIRSQKTIWVMKVWRMDMMIEVQTS